MVITLEEAVDTTQFDRTRLDDKSITILDVSVPHVIIPVGPGRNVGTLVEIAALNQKLKGMGIHTAQEMEKRLLKELARRREIRENITDRESST